MKDACVMASNTLFTYLDFIIILAIRSRRNAPRSFLKNQRFYRSTHLIPTQFYFAVTQWKAIILHIIALSIKNNVLLAFASTRSKNAQSKA
jgi:hypothetical protein